jgi:hypothetical protein
MHPFEKVYTSLFPCAMINRGVKMSVYDVIHLDLSYTHYWKQRHNKRLLSDYFSDDSTIEGIRSGEATELEKTLLKRTLRCWQPSCYMPDKTAGIKPQVLNPILCLDFDHLQDWDIESLKAHILDLPFVAFVSLSCSGTGLYALLLIEEPQRLKAYAEHCLTTF